MYADRMRIVVELGGSIARGQREREREGGVLHKIHLWLWEKNPSRPPPQPPLLVG